MDPDANAELDNEIRLSMSDTVSAASNPEGLVLLANAAKRVWEELYVSKKPVCILELLRTRESRE